MAPTPYFSHDAFWRRLGLSFRHFLGRLVPWLARANHSVAARKAAAADNEEASIHKAIVRSHISRDDKLLSYIRSLGSSGEPDDLVIRASYFLGVSD